MHELQYTRALMKISIGHRLFAAVLLAIVAVTATGIALMQHKVLASFSDYAVEIELERLEELSALLGRQYEEAKAELRVKSGL